MLSRRMPKWPAKRECAQGSFPRPGRTMTEAEPGAALSRRPQRGRLQQAFAAMVHPVPGGLGCVEQKGTITFDCLIGIWCYRASF